MERTVETKKKIQDGILNSDYILNKEYNLKNWSLINGNPERIKKQKETWINKLYEKGWINLKIGGKKSIVLHEQNNSCLICKLDTWNGNKLTLELDHVDGNKKNETRENLRCLCPNCHSQTPTWRRIKNKIGM